MLVVDRIAINSAISLGALLSLFSTISVPQEASAQLPVGGCGRVSDDVKSSYSRQLRGKQNALERSHRFLKDRGCKIRRSPVNVDYDNDDYYDDYPPVIYGRDGEAVDNDGYPIRTCNPRSWRQPRGYNYVPAKKQEWHQGLTNDEVRAKTIWSGADRNDRKMQAQIIEKQLRDSPEAPETIEQAWNTAQYFLASQKPALAEPLLKEIVVTIETHKMTNQNRKILGEARSKLLKLEAIRERIKDKQDPRTDIASRYGVPIRLNPRRY